MSHARGTEGVRKDTRVAEVPYSYLSKAPATANGVRPLHLQGSNARVLPTPEPPATKRHRPVFCATPLRRRSRCAAAAHRFGRWVSWNRSQTPGRGAGRADSHGPSTALHPLFPLKKIVDGQIDGQFLKRRGGGGYEQELTRGHDCEPRTRQGAATDSSSAGGASAGVTVVSRGKQSEAGCELIFLILSASSSRPQPLPPQLVR